MDMQKKVKVWNRGSGSISYNIDELRVRREWAKPGDVQMVSLEELQAVRYMPGGAKLMDKYMLIKDQDACEFLGLPTDPEYFYDENDVRVLLKEGSEDQLLDCLEFAPSGVIDLIKKIAVEIKLDSSRKREIISEHLKINIDSMIRNDIASKEEDPANSVEGTGAARQRRSAPVTATKTPEYKVVNRSK